MLRHLIYWRNFVFNDLPDRIARSADYDTHTWSEWAAFNRALYKRPRNNEVLPAGLPLAKS